MSRAQAQVCAGYSITSGPGTFTAGTTDIGNHCDDCVTSIALPFGVNFYGTVYNSATVGSNGTFQFTTTNTTYANVCLPTTTFGATIFPFWDDLYTSGTANGQGVFTGLSGAPGSQVFVVEWRTGYCCTAATPINDFELKFYENQSYIDIVYSPTMADRSSATIGVQDGTGQFVQYVCNTAGPAPSTSLRINCLSSSTAGACCNTVAGTCAIANQADCTPAANFQGIGTACPAACPVQGSCCAAAGGCTITGPGGCTGTSTFTSGGVCNPYPCPPPPNDECTAAIVVTAGTPVNGGNVGATPSVTLVNNGTGVCNQTTFNTGVHNDVWFRFTPTATTNYTVDTCGSGMDTVIYVVSACPADQTNMLDCNDDSTTTGDVACPSNGLNSRIPSIALTAGQTYYIGVAGYNGATGSFVLNVNISNAGACCNTTSGACTASISGAAGCAAGTAYQGDNSSCTPNPCGQGACCNDSTAVCSLATASSCASGSTFQGAGTTCVTGTCSTVACCNPTTGVCSTIGPAGSCPSGTTSQGVGTSCTPNPCPQPPPPANDDCSSAVALTVGNSVGGTTTNATQSVTATCTGSVKDVWYTFTAPAAGGYGFTASVDAGSATTFMPSVSIFSSCPASSGGNDAAPAGCQAQGGTGFVQRAGMNAGDQLWIRVADFAGDNTAFHIVAGTVTIGACCNNTTGACTTSNTGAGGCAAGTTYQGDNSGCNPSPCPTEACCNAATGVCTTAAVGACASGTTGQGTGSACSPNPCPQPPPPANDNCASAIVLCDGTPVSGVTSGATNDGTGSCAASAASPDVWYSYTPTISGTATISLCGSSYDTALAVLDSCGGTEVACNDDSCGLQSQVTPTLNAGQTYLIRVSGFNGATGAYTLTASGGGAACGSTGVCCRGATCSTTVTQASCTGSGLAGAAFASSASACNGTSTTSPCCYANYNKVGGITVQDIFDFLNDWFAGNPFTNTGSNGTGQLAVQNIFDFLNAWFAGGCS